MLFLRFSNSLASRANSFLPGQLGQGGSAERVLLAPQSGNAIASTAAGNYAQRRAGFVRNSSPLRQPARRPTWPRSARDQGSLPSKIAAYACCTASSIMFRSTGFAGETRAASCPVKSNVVELSEESDIRRMAVGICASVMQNLM